jgi:Mn-dependent DtxR family transcriptional regulator
MLYTRSRVIENRLNTIVGLIRAGGQSTLTLATALGVSRPTVCRCIAALRDRGYSIRSVKNAVAWSYAFMAEPAPVNQG